MGKAKAFKRFIIGSGLAAAAGYVAGVLTAPKSGKQTRDELMDLTNKNISEAEKELKKLHTDLNKMINDSKKQGDKLSGKAEKDLKTLLERAQDTKEKAREMISAIHEGGADDKDLQRAIKDANAALDHIRDYLKK